MRTIERTTQFKKDYQLELKGKFSTTLEKRFTLVLQYLINDVNLPIKYMDHKLQGEYADCRDCHIYPDLVLIYQKTLINSLKLIRLGSHSKLFG
jgi:mRNA interferase YafQ